MNIQAIKAYIDSQPQKVVTLFDYEQRKISYDNRIRGWDIREIKGDEEVVRAYLLTKLVNELGYLPEHIEIEHKYTAGRPHTNTSRIDVIVRDGNGNAFLFMELKAPDAYSADDATIEEQLFKVAGMERTDGHKVKYLALYTVSENGDILSDECVIIDNEKYQTYAEWEEMRNNTNTLPARYGKAQKVPYIKGSEHDLETNFYESMLSSIQSDLHNVLWGGGGTDDNEVFSSLTNLILAKIQDEDEKEDGQTYDFQSLCFEKDGDEEFESNETLFERINALYRRALTEKLYLLDQKEIEKSYVVDTKKFSLSKLKYAVQKLEGLSLVDGKNSINGKDILGNFFEGIIRDGFKQSKGQFFTHVNIVRFMLWGLQTDKLAIKRIKEDRELPYMIDPSAGSGTFLIEYMRFITENMKHRFRPELGTSRAVQDKINSDWFYPDHRENKWAQTYIYGSEINFNLGTATKVNMILHGDGSTNIFVKDGLLPFARYEKETAPNALHDSTPDGFYIFKVKSGWNKKFVLYLLRSTKIKRIINEHIYRGIGISSYKVDDLLNLRIPFVPIEKQNTIVDTVLPIENGIKKLKMARKNEYQIIDEVFAREFEFDYDTFEKLKKVKSFTAHSSWFTNNPDLRFSAKFHRPAGEYVMNELNRITDKKIKHFLAEPIVLGASVSPSDYDDDGEYCYISMATIKNWEFNPDIANSLSPSYSQAKIDKTVRKNDIIMARSGEGTIGKVALIEEDDINGIFSDFTMRIRLKDYGSQFAHFYFRTTFFQYFVEIFKKGLGNNTNIFPIVLREFPIPNISLDEQQRIADEITAEIEAQEQIHAQISELRKQIDRVITEAITA